MSTLEWILDGLDPEITGWGGDAAERMSADFARRWPPQQFVRIIRAKAEEFGTSAVESLVVTGPSANATLSTSVGKMVASIATDERESGLLRSCTIAPLIGPGLVARLPETFGPDNFLGQVSSGSRMIVFAGLPGTGKSTLADRLGRETSIPVFATDWLLGALTPFGGRFWDNLLGIAAEQLTHLAYRQLELGQSVILDHPVEDVALRHRWASMARAAGTEFFVILCQCEDPELHESRLSTRTRGIPGWHEAGSWTNVAQRREAFVPWTGERVLVVDAATPLEENLESVRAFVDGKRPSAVDHG